MSESPARYDRSFEDELDWSLLDQLHRVALQISTFCFRTKQVCVTVEIAVVGLLARFLDDQLDHSVFVAGLLIPLVFWVLDSIGYYYQVKVRGVMDGLRARLRERNTQSLVLPGAPAVIEGDRVSGSTATRLRDAFINHSMWLYLILVLVDTALWLAFTQGGIR